MNRSNTIQDELKDLNSDLLSFPNGTSYEVPAGYFESLAASVLSKIKAGEVSAAVEIAELSPLIAGISRNIPFSVPQNYFQSNIESLSALTAEENSLVLSFIEKEMPQSVPAGYFENLPERIIQKVSQKETPVVSIRRKWMRMAAAAVVAGIITVSGIFYMNNRNKETDLAGAPVAQQLKNVSTRELDEFIKTTVTTTTNTETAQTTPVKTAEVKQLLQDVSDNELQAFLDQVPTEDEEVMTN